MQRDLAALEAAPFDVLVLGGGIMGATLAWEAAGRGLRVALLERDDFAAATSANSLKTIHGGFRYLQSLDLARVRRSVRERAALLRIAPHLVRPLPVLVPTYGHGRRGRELFAAGLPVYDLLAPERARQPDPGQRIPPGRMLTPAELAARLPDLPRHGVSGAALFWDAQAHSTERLVLAFLEAASRVGAQLANGVTVIGLLRQDEQVVGVHARDRLTGAALTVRAAAVLDARGPWLGPERAPFALSRAVNLVLPPLFGDAPAAQTAVGLLGAGGKMLFVSPWRGVALLGTHYAPLDAAAPPAQVAAPPAAAVQTLLDDLRAAYPHDLTAADVRLVHVGLLPAARAAPDRLWSHDRVLDGRKLGAPGWWGAAAVKYTTARALAVEVVEAAAAALGRTLAPSISAHTPLPGGEIADYAAFGRALLARPRPAALSAALVADLGRSYGTEAAALLDEAAAAPDPLPALWRAQTRRAVQDEMALTLADVILRRTDLGSAGPPPEAALQTCAATMADLLGWDAPRQAAEIAALRASYPAAAWAAPVLEAV
jgi:glycerol-3-phosphate dehydrogenase